MSYFSDYRELKASGIDMSGYETPDDQPRGCIEPTNAYGATPGVPRFEEFEDQGIVRIPREEWPERIEALERAKATIQHRIDRDWAQPLYQGRCGYCWAYSVIGAMQSANALNGMGYVALSAASVAAQIKSGRDQGGWPVDAAAWVEQRGVCELEDWGDCTCGGKSCRGPRGGCPARDLRQIEDTQEKAKANGIGIYGEVPRDDFDAAASLALLGIPAAYGWIDHPGLWCNNHAMHVSRLIRTSKRGYELIPDNSWRKFKRRVPVPIAPTGGVFILSTKVAA